MWKSQAGLFRKLQPVFQKPCRGIELLSICCDYGTQGRAAACGSSGWLMGAVRASHMEAVHQDYANTRSVERFRESTGGFLSIYKENDGGIAGIVEALAHSYAEDRRIRFHKGCGIFLLGGQCLVE